MIFINFIIISLKEILLVQKDNFDNKSQNICLEFIIILEF